MEHKNINDSERLVLKDLKMLNKFHLSSMSRTTSLSNEVFSSFIFSGNYAKKKVKKIKELYTFFFVINRIKCFFVCFCSEINMNIRTKVRLIKSVKKVEKKSRLENKVRYMNTKKNRNVRMKKKQNDG